MSEPTTSGTTSWDDWAAARPRGATLHLDSASAGRSSAAVLDAVAAHLRAEARDGGYVAAEHAAPVVEQARADTAALLGTDAAGVAFVESATAALDVLLDVWPLPEHARVGTTASSWGPNVELVEHRGHRPELLPVDDLGVLDLDTLEVRLRQDPPDVLLLDLVAAHRGLVQPAREAVEVAHAHGVAVWVDAAQGIGHVDATSGADASLATSRKWLTGPRGVGMVAVAPSWRDRLRVRPLAKQPGSTPVQRLESGEAHVAGRVGLGVALRELHDLGPARVHARLAEVGARVREAVAGLPGWEVVLPQAPAGALTAVAPTAGQDVVAVQARLLHDHGVLTTVCLPWRAPSDDAVAAWPVLRVSPHLDLSDDDLERLVAGLLAAGPDRGARP
ncbi:pyridoxal 5-phosphate dependent beta-lyase [Nocardioides scoriae]|uniref:Pyridoxal 5-phosphate dependent beta-lyase n=1 Tax=Nocardioides scoriae TaxID=642780 RepID=A0A1H1Q9G9_9ACTN|nr:aminotransferase class V-fold PLP-dependent enzyme [Nocardioides scoriae]SDS20096.1 pyridoxal 5-phosphate dependent beta-lyase [Nocardioides scoriae]